VVYALSTAASALTCADNIAWGVRGGRRGAEAAPVSASTAALLFFSCFFSFFFATLALNCRNTSLVASSSAQSSGVRPLCSKRQMMR
jgi:hypothetical protein